MVPSLLQWESEGFPDSSGSQSVAMGPAASVSLGNLLEMQILRPTESESLRWGPAICVSTSPLDDSDAA